MGAPSPAIWRIQTTLCSLAETLPAYSVPTKLKYLLVQSNKSSEYRRSIRPELVDSNGAQDGE